MDEQSDSFGPIYNVNPGASDSRALPSPDERRLRVLKVLVEAYSENGRPVPVSVLLERTEPAINPETIEDDLAHLEAEQLVEPASGSGARVPTQQSYRWYKDHFASRRQGSGDRRRHVPKPPTVTPVLRVFIALGAVATMALVSLALALTTSEPWPGLLYVWGIIVAIWFGLDSLARGSARPLLGLAFVVVLLGLAVQSAEAFHKKDWVSTDGIVAVNRQAICSQCGSGDLAVDYLNYRTPEDDFYPSLGHDTPTRMGSYESGLAVGDAVVVYFNPDDPTDSSVVSPASEWVDVGVFAALAAGLIAALRFVARSKNSAG